MTEITVKHESASGAAVIEIRGSDVSETRFRLRDPSSEKYLTKRGWTKTASFLPVEATVAEGVVMLTLETDLARKIAPDTALSLEQPGGFRQALVWSAPVPTIAEDAISNAAGQDPDPEPLMLDSFEPAILHEHLHDDDKPATPDKIDPASLADPESRPSSWRPAAMAAIIFLLLGTGIGYALNGSDSAAVKQARQTAAMQLEKQKWEFDRQLSEARQQVSVATSDKTTISDAHKALADKALADKEKSIAELQKQLTEANDQIGAGTRAAKQQAEAQRVSHAAEIAQRDSALKDMKAKLGAASDELAAVRQSARSQSDTKNTALTEKIRSLTAEVKLAEQAVAERDSALRDVQAKLSVANIQVDALKVVAGKTTEAGLEKTAMSLKLAQMTAELDKTSQSLSDREQALADANARLVETQTRLAAADKRDDAVVTAPQPDQTQTASGETTARLQQERDLYASELKTMTANFSTLQAQKLELEKTVAALQAESRQASLTTSQISSKAIWGATAIDQTGAIYSLQNQTGEKVAQDNVTAMCRGKSGARCEALTAYSNACFSVARFQGEGPSADNYAYFVHKDWKTASQTALERCQSTGTACTVRFTACSPDGLSKPISE